MTPSGPLLTERNVCNVFALVLTTFFAASICPFITTSTPRPSAFSSAAVRTACQRFMGPSALMAEAGRMAPVSTVGFSVCIASCRKYAVSSRVSVPWVMTMPSTSLRAAISFARLASCSQMLSCMSLLSMLHSCSPDRSANRSSPGTEAISCATVSSPALYPTVAEAEAACPAMVPPVAIIYTCGFCFITYLLHCFLTQALKFLPARL